MTNPLDRLAAALADHYRIERELGAGGMATVYLAEDLKHQRKVAVKVLRPELAATLGPERFLREVSIAANLQHPHILMLIDSGAADGFLYYVMPFVEGPSLRQKLIREGELPIPEAVRILRDVADAIGYAHQHGVVHRDIKPENVMLSGRHALVTDFGVAKAVSEATGRQSLTTVGVALGTPAYMAPEQAAADPHTDHRADLYAFGVVAYELLTGQPPFTGASPQAVMAAHMTTAALPVISHRASIPPALAALVMKCLEKKPADRWQSADELLPQLEAALTPSGGMTPTETLPLAAVLPPVRRRWPVIAGAVATLAVVAAGAGLALRSRAKPLDTGRVLVVPFEMQGSAPNVTALPQRLESAIVQGLQRTGLASVSDSRTAVAEASFGDTAAATLATTTIARRLARDIGSGLVVVGRVLVLGDTVQVVSKLLATASGTEVVAVQTESGPATGTAALVDAVTQRLMGALAMHRDPRWGSSLPGARASTYAAYRAFQEGNDHWNRGEYRSAADRYRHAFTLDTMFVGAAIRYGYALFNFQDYAAVDSLSAALEPKRASLSPYETQYLNRLLAWTRGDNQAFYSAAREMGRIAPQSNIARYTAARSAIVVNRMDEARAGLLAVDIESPDLPGVEGMYGDLCDASHHLSDHETELKWAREWSSHPRNQTSLRAAASEATALVGLGRVREVDALFARFLTTRPEGNVPPIVLALSIVAELRWHGHDTTARRLSRVALDRAASAMQPGERVQFLFAVDDTNGATQLADSMYRADTTSVAAMRWMGTMAAVRKDVPRARAILQQMERGVRPYDRGTTTRARAEILALLGEKDQAVLLLQQAFAEGASFQANGYHARFGLEPLRGFAPFEAFIKPK